MIDAPGFAARFEAAVESIDLGDLDRLGRLLRDDPALVRDRLEIPWTDLVTAVGIALNGYFARPYLLWFIAENPTRHGRLPANIAEVAGVVIEASRRHGVSDLPGRLGETLGLVVSGRVPRESGVQIALIDALIDAGAPPDRVVDALGSGNLEAAAHLIERGAPLTLASAICLGLDDATIRLGPISTPDDRRIALAAAALNGREWGLAYLIDLGGIDLDAYSLGLHPHATALHHAVASGSMEAVQVLIEAGASLEIRDTIYGGTPLGWATHLDHREIAEYLRRHGCST